MSEVLEFKSRFIGMAKEEGMIGIMPGENYLISNNTYYPTNGKLMFMKAVLVELPINHEMMGRDSTTYLKHIIPIAKTTINMKFAEELLCDKMFIAKLKGVVYANKDDIVKKTCDSMLDPFGKFFDHEGTLICALADFLETVINTLALEVKKDV